MNRLQVRIAGTAMDSTAELRVLRIARALGDPTRFLIYKHIIDAGEIRCGDISLDTPVRASTVSHHLKVLSGAGLVCSRREGQGVYYRALPSCLDGYLRYMRTLERKGSIQKSSHAWEEHQ